MFNFTHEMLTTWIALGLEVSLFIAIPIYLRARWRREIRSRIRILNDSRRPENFRSAKVLPFSSIRSHHDRRPLSRRVA